MASVRSTWRGLGRRGRLFALAALAVFLSGVAGAVAGRLVTGDLPSVRELESWRPQTVTEVFSADGELVTMLGSDKRILLSRQEIPQEFINAVIATEDRRFYDHFGIDARGAFRAVVANLKERRFGAQGASTLSMQLARSLFLTPEKTVRRKALETLLALEIERTYSKEEILTFYCNHVYTGPRRYGVEAAARYYLGKTAGEVELSEAALLAGIIQNPSRLSPYRHPERATKRREHVLNKMLEAGMITSEQFETANAQPLRLERRGEQDTTGSYFVEAVRRELVDRYGEEGLFRSGLKVRTTLDPDLQRAATEALRKGLMDLQSRRGWLEVFPSIADSERTGDDGKPFAPENWIDFSWDPEPGPGDRVTAVVTSVNSKRVVLRVADRSFDVDRKGIEWSGEKDPRKVFRKGDLVPVRLAPEPDDEDEDADGTPEAPAKDEEKPEAPGPPLVIEPAPQIEGAVVAIEPATGEVLALVGGFDFARSEFNRATQARRQPGSAFKPFVAAAALEAGLTPSERILDEPTVFLTKGGTEPYQPENYLLKYTGLITMRQTLENSRNIAAVRLLTRIGPQPAIRLARKMGIESPLHPYPSLALGSFELTPMELTAAFAVFPNQGIWVEPHLIRSVIDAQGEERHVAQPRTREALSPVTAYQVTHMLRGVIRSGTATKARALGRDLGGKTGTTNDYSDAWFVGFSPTLAVGVWVGMDQKMSLGKGESGSRAALPIWIDIMSSALGGRPNIEFPRPSGISLVPVDRTTGMRSTIDSRCLPGNVILEAFAEGNEVLEACSPAEHARIRLPYFLQRFQTTSTGALSPDVDGLVALLRDDPVSVWLWPDGRWLDVSYSGRTLTLPVALDEEDRGELLRLASRPPTPPRAGPWLAVDDRPATVIRFD